MKYIDFYTNYPTVISPFCSLPETLLSIFNFGLYERTLHTCPARYLFKPDGSRLPLWNLFRAPEHSPCKCELIIIVGTGTASNSSGKIDQTFPKELQRMRGEARNELNESNSVAREHLSPS